MGQQQDYIKNILSKSEKITAAPSESNVWKILEAVTGVPLDPDFYRFARRDEIFASLAPQIGMAMMPAAKLADQLGAVPNATKGLVKQDPYGFQRGPIERRQFLDRLMGNATKRAKIKSQHLWQTTDKNGYSDETFKPAFEFSEELNKNFGFPNIINKSFDNWIVKDGNKWRKAYPGELDWEGNKNPVGPVMEIYNWLKSR